MQVFENHGNRHQCCPICPCGSEKDYHTHAGIQLTWPDGCCGAFEDVTCSNATEVWRQQSIKQCRLARIGTAKNEYLPWNKVKYNTTTAAKCCNNTMFLPRCMKWRCGLVMRILSVRLSISLSKACIVTKCDKDMSRFLYHTKDYLPEILGQLAPLEWNCRFW